MPETARENTEETLSWLRSAISEAIGGWIASHPAEPAYWRDPLVAVASADDPLFETLRQVIDPAHATPGEILPGARSVIVFFLPFQRSLGKENAALPRLAARSWAQAYVTTNALIAAINGHLEALLGRKGYAAAVTPATHNFDPQKLISLWSHKHIGYIAGLGTFGRSHLLITREGCCGRLGSLITTMSLPATARPGEEWCRHKAGKACEACVAKCPVDALGPETFDRKRCYDHLLEVDAYYSDLATSDVCGKCGCEMPCSYGLPAGRGH